mgnify:CR=1 FL=1
MDMSGWWRGSRDEFLNQSPDEIAGKLTTIATTDGWKIEPEQATEWRESISLLRAQAFDDPIGILREALRTEQLDCIDSVVLEYDFRRRGLRIDAVLLLGSHAIVVEFKRSKLSAGDRDQVVNYCVNLCEFHQVTQDSVKRESAMVIPILVSREDKSQKLIQTDLSDCFQDWKAIPKRVATCYGGDLRNTLVGIAEQLTQTPSVSVESWDKSPFSPSSTIIDAALSLYGNHDVSAIKEHANEMETINKCTNEIKAEIHESRSNGGRSLIFMSGAPGAGKTLVGLDIVFSSQLRDDAVFLTGNAPLVDVLKGSLKRSYRSMSARKINQLTGYSKKGVKFVEKNTVFKIVKAHHFLKINKNKEQAESTDGDVLIIDEAQRTYEKGRIVIDHKLEDHEANLIVEQMEGRSNPVIVLLIGHNQHINRGERGAKAWLEAAEKYGWRVSISDDTLNLSEFDSERDKWSKHPLRRELAHGHLQDSIRYYRNKSVEKWAHYVLSDSPRKANKEARTLNEKGHNIWITRSLENARNWARNQRLGEERTGLIASGKGVRLAAEGIFPSLKPNIANWMLSPMGDIRSSNMLETAQNQFQIQGLELDYTVVCWDADLRIEDGIWSCYNISGRGWQNSKQESALIERKNGYRVLLTRARKGMVIFVPRGDLSEPLEDETRDPEYYDGIYEYLLSCGSISIDE